MRLEKDRNSRVAAVESVWYHDGRPILKFAGIDSISQAEEWEGADILVPGIERVRPGEGEYTHADLIGCRVLRNDTEDQVGVVRGIEEYGASVLLDVEPAGGGELLVPFAREICREIDIKRKLIRVWLPPGL